MKIFLKSLKYYALFPIIACLPGFVLNLCGFFWMNMNIVVVPALTAVLYILFRKKIDMAFAMKANGAIFLVLTVIFTIMMMIAKGNVESLLMGYFSCLILPFFPIMIMMAIMGKFAVLYVCAILSYLAAFIVTACYEKVNIRKLVVPVSAVLVCVTTSTVLYVNRPLVKYAGHGFDYMRGYSSTDLLIIWYMPKTQS